MRDICAFVDNINYDKILKKAYLIFVEYCKQVTWRNYDLVSFLINGLVDCVLTLDRTVQSTADCQLHPRIQHSSVYSCQSQESLHQQRRLVLLRTPKRSRKSTTGKLSTPTSSLLTQSPSSAAVPTTNSLSTL